ncbi:MAG: Gfo/Idh/MocA family oxidoreductase [Candidatus Omnitrophota bacterium]|nr:Gfo/Idh/MocA family oxidoreductase [Candidatus Omnitrophota bacterium]
MKKWRVGLIGCGRISKIHTSVYPALSSVELVAVCDIIEDRARSYADKFGCPAYLDYKQMLKSEDIDIIDICTPTHMHARMAIDSAEARKHVVSEKPVAITLPDADRMIEACRKNNVKLFVVKQNRYNPPIVKLKEAVDKERFGRIFYGKTTVYWQRDQHYYDEHEWFRTRGMGGGVIINQASHNIDMLCWLMGPVDSVFARIDTLTHKIDTEDFGLGLVKFKSGAWGIIEATTCVFPKNLEGSVTILGENGTAKVGGIQMNKIQMWEFKDKNDDENIQGLTQDPPNVYGYGHKTFFEDVLRVLNGENIPYVDGNEGKLSLGLISAMYESAATGKEVKMAEFINKLR